MTVNSNALWDSSLRLIKENVEEQQYNTWFKPLVFESYNADTKTLLLQVPSAFFYEYLEENYVSLLSSVLTRCFGHGIKLTYRVVTDKAHHLTQDLQGEPSNKVDTRRPTDRANQSPTPMDAAPQDLDPQLDPHKTFNNYLEGDSNKLPRSIGLSIAEHPNTTQFNPMFIYGPSGCGKTHLVNAIGMRAKQLYPQKRVLYISARLFQVQYTNSVRNNTTNDFINFYQTIDILIVDDIQEWMTAIKTQDTFFHIFNHLFRNGKRIILASDRPPVDLKGMNERLLTRCSSFSARLKACGCIATEVSSIGQRTVRLLPGACCTAVFCLRTLFCCAVLTAVRISIWASAYLSTAKSACGLCFWAPGQAIPLLISSAVPSARLRSAASARRNPLKALSAALSAAL